MARPRRFLVRMLLFLIAVAAVAAAVFDPLRTAFMANPPLNGLILGVLILGIVAAQGNDTILKLQFSAGMAKGDLQESDLTEIPIFLSQYAGFPLSVVANTAAQKVRNDLSS